MPPEHVSINMGFQQEIWSLTKQNLITIICCKQKRTCFCQKLTTPEVFIFPVKENHLKILS